MEKKGKLIIVSNRLPISVSKKAGKISFQRSIGGLATGLASFYKEYDSLWVGWPGIAYEKIREDFQQVKKELKKDKCVPVALPQSLVEQFYHGFCNKTIWPLFHYFPNYAVFSDTLWNAYKKGNELFAEALEDILRPGDTVWIHDFHLMLLPRLLRESIEDLSIGFFLHIPFPSSEIFRLMPWRDEVLEGLLGADLVGFHTADYVGHFLSSVRRILGYENSFNQILAENRMIQADVFPMGIDYKTFKAAVGTDEVKAEIERIKRRVGDSKVIISVDRLDYTKGLLHRLEAFERFLDRYPKWRGKVTFILLVVPSRVGVEQYAKLKKNLDEMVGRINGKYDTIGWIPIWYLYRSVPQSVLSALYAIGDVALITPIRDGMNLVAKEYVASKIDGNGVLVLGELAGAAREMGEAIIVSPLDRSGVADAIKQALEMPSEEKALRISAMQKRLERYDVVRWARDFMERLTHTKEKQAMFMGKKLAGRDEAALVKTYASAHNRVLFLDYDGTLVGFRDKPEKAMPDKELLEILERLTRQKATEIVIVSGRDPYTLQNWFSSLKVNIIAEHGVWLKEIDGDWEMIELLDSEWKEKVRPILELYTDRTPGSFIEEKEFSLVWHYRRCDPILATVRSRELKDALLQLIANLEIGVLEGNKVIEIKNTSINKGRAILHWLARKDYDFMFVAGDDWTDEDMFEVLPDWAYSIKIGFGISKARYRLDSPFELRQILMKLASIKGK